MPCNIDSPLFDRFVEFHQICVATWELCWNAKPSVCIDKKVTRNICLAKEMDGSSFWGLIMHDKCKTVQRERERERESHASRSRQMRLCSMLQTCITAAAGNCKLQVSMVPTGVDETSVRHQNGQWSWWPCTGGSSLLLKFDKRLQWLVFRKQGFNNETPF